MSCTNGYQYRAGDSASGPDTRRPLCIGDHETTPILPPLSSGLHRSKNPQFVGAGNIGERNSIVRKIASTIFNAGYMLLSKLLGWIRKMEMVFVLG